MLRAACRVVEAQGLDALTTRAVAARAGLTQPAIYRHFASKEALADRVLDKIRVLFRVRVREAIQGKDAEHALRAALDAFRTFAVAKPHLFDALFMRHPRRRGVPTSRGAVFSLLVERVRVCMKGGFLEPGDPVDVALTLAACARGLVMLYRRERFESAEAFASFYHRSLDRIFDGMARRSGDWRR